MNKQQLDGHCSSNIEKLAYEFGLTAHQVDQLQKYEAFLVEWNEKFNLTAILESDKIAQYHFYDSLAISRYVDFSQVQVAADVGTGAGFPAIPLKIMFPRIKMILIEVNSKKRTFLEYVAKELGLEEVVTYPNDWRTFLRSTDYGVDYFFARASLQPQELVRIFKPSSAYKDATLIYWASEKWIAGKPEAPFIKKEVMYEIETDLSRKYVFCMMK